MEPDIAAGAPTPPLEVQQPPQNLLPMQEVVQIDTAAVIQGAQSDKRIEDVAVGDKADAVSEASLPDEHARGGGIGDSQARAVAAADGVGDGSDSDSDEKSDAAQEQEGADEDAVRSQSIDVNPTSQEAKRSAASGTVDAVYSGLHWIWTYLDMGLPVDAGEQVCIVCVAFWRASRLDFICHAVGWQGLYVCMRSMYQEAQA